MGQLSCRCSLWWLGAATYKPRGSRDIAAHQLPVIVGNIQRVAMIGLFITIFLSMKMLPPRPERYKRQTFGLYGSTMGPDARRCQSFIALYRHLTPKHIYYLENTSISLMLQIKLLISPWRTLGRRKRRTTPTSSATIR